MFSRRCDCYRTNYTQTETIAFTKSNADDDANADSDTKSLTKPDAHGHANGNADAGTCSDNAYAEFVSAAERVAQTS